MSRDARFTLEQISVMSAEVQRQVAEQLAPKRFLDLANIKYENGQYSAPWVETKLGEPHAIPDKTHRPAPAPVVERDLRPRPLAAGKAEKGHPRKFLVRVTSFRRRLLDEDNLCEKYHVDCCRYSGLLAEDAPGQARIVTSQEKVSRKEDERTEIEISPLD